jgi:hypothetical protein
MSLEESWDRTMRPNEVIEIEALRRTLKLEEACRHTLGDRYALLAPTSAEQRFKLHAGMLMVTAVVPFGANDRTVLRDRLRWGFNRSDLDGWRAGLPPREDKLIDSWRRWLRMNGDEPAELGSGNYGEATLLYEAALGILDAAGRVLGRDSRPGKYQQTSFGLPQHE